MTNLVERYLAAVERRLPKDGAADIIAELREAINAQIEARTDETGHETTADEVAAALKGFGHPAMVATRYSGREYLIGPKLYPWFWDAQRTGVGLVLAISFIVMGVRALRSDQPVSFMIQSFDNVLEGAIFAFGLITVVFVILERTKTDLKLAARWNPRDLPQDHVRKPKSLFEAVFSIAADLVFIMWWTGLITFPNTVPGEGGSMTVEFSDAWAAVHAPILALASLSAAVHLADLFYPAWSPLRAVVSIIGHIGGLAVVWVLLRAGPLVSVEAATAEGERAVRIADHVNMLIVPSLGVLGLFWAIAIGVEVWRLWRSMRPAGETHAASAA